MDHRVYEEHLSRISELQRLIELEEQKLFNLMKAEKESQCYNEQLTVSELTQYAS